MEAEELGAEGEEPLFLPTPSFMESAEEEFFPLSFLRCCFLGASYISLG